MPDNVDKPSLSALCLGGVLHLQTPFGLWYSHQAAQSYPTITLARSGALRLGGLPLAGHLPAGQYLPAGRLPAVAGPEGPEGQGGLAVQALPAGLVASAGRACSLAYPVVLERSSARRRRSRTHHRPVWVAGQLARLGCLDLADGRGQANRHADLPGYNDQQSDDGDRVDPGASLAVGHQMLK